MEMSAADLSRFDGREGRPAYVAYKGVIYDVSASGMWTGGDHEGVHVAGHDLTSEHDDAPHDVYVADFPKVGTLT
jgi:predicted heme/steroid binding protein